MKLVKYELTYEPLEDGYFKELPAKIREIMADAYEKIKSNPKHLIIEFDKIPSKYSNNAVILNYLATAYSHDKNIEKAKEITIRNYEKNENYLFAKINYAQICIKDKNYNKIPEIFNNKFELKALYPKRRVFHISEFLNFYWIMGTYFYNIGNIDQAKSYYSILKTIEPGDKLTKSLKKLIYPSFFRKWLLKKTAKYEKDINNKIVSEE